MKYKIFNNPWQCVITLSILIFTLPAFSIERIIPNIQATDILNNNISLESVLPKSNHVIVVVDAYSSKSILLLSGLKNKDFDGTGLIVIVSAQPVQANAFIKDQKMLLPKAIWLHATTQVVMSSLALNGTPFIFGNDEKNLIRWQYAGVPTSAEKTLSLIRDWILKP